MFCVCIKGPTLEQVRQQLTLAQQHTSFVELRLDFWDTVEIPQIQRLMSEYPLSFCLTYRPKGQDEKSRKKKLLDLIALRPGWMDVESFVDPCFVDNLKSTSPQTKIIVSFHDFEMIPDLTLTLHQMQKIKGELYKIAVTPQSSSEALSLLRFMQKNPRVLTVGMGEHGLITRALGLHFGAAWIYASLDEESAVAPGQVPIQDLQQIYQGTRINPSTSLYGLIGDPIDQSIGHIVHNGVMSQCNLNSVYVKYRVTPNELPAFLQLAKTVGLKGLSVTMPLKEAVLEHLDEIDPWAKKIGAVNTLVFQHGKHHGYNTDGRGALDAIEDKTTVKGKRVLFIGAGGAAKAAIAMALERGAEVVILNRDENRAKTIASALGAQWGPLSQIAQEYQRGYEILVNTTPVSCPIDLQWVIPGCVVMDMKTRSTKDPWMHKAQVKGCTLVHGHEMFIHQAIGQYELWFGKNVQVKQMIRKLCLNLIKAT